MLISVCLKYRSCTNLQSILLSKYACSWLVVSLFKHKIFFWFFCSLQYHAFSYITSILNSERFSVEEQEKLKEEAFNQLEVTEEIHWKTVLQKNWSYHTQLCIYIFMYLTFCLFLRNYWLTLRCYEKTVYISVQESTPLEYYDNIPFTVFKIFFNEILICNSFIYHLVYLHGL